jgi:hypothetical protein
VKDAFKPAWKIFKYLSVLFSVIYWIAIVIDDYVFIEKYWTMANWAWLGYIGLWILYFVFYFLAFSFYFWVAAAIVIVVYRKLIKRSWRQGN